EKCLFFYLVRFLHKTFYTTCKSDLQIGFFYETSIDGGIRPVILCQLKIDKPFLEGGFKIYAS
ncbi:MAG: hypothetical protein SV375_19045, partial [Thermodesulfobacteriota bacterium]|nr:hypothetical protein [Thermodesulfobacteriota bacterium]